MSTYVCLCVLWLCLGYVPAWGENSLNKLKDFIPLKTDIVRVHNYDTETTNTSSGTTPSPSTNSTTQSTTVTNNTETTNTSSGTTPSPSTTAAPATSSPPPVVSGKVHDENGNTCILIEITLEIHFSYKKTNGLSGEVTILAPKNVDISGNCTSDMQYITFSWNTKETVVLGTRSKRATTANNITSVTFAVQTTDTYYKVQSIAGQVAVDDSWPDAQPGQVISFSNNDSKVLNQLSASTGYSYQCKSSTSVSASGGVNLNLENVKVETYKNAQSANPGFSQAQVCSQDYIAVMQSNNSIGFYFSAVFFLAVLLFSCLCVVGIVWRSCATRRIYSSRHSV